MTKKRIWFLFGLTLIAGVMAGAAIMQVYIQTRLKVLMRGEQERYYEYFLRRLTTELSLTEAQYGQVKTALLANQEQLTRLRQQIQPEAERLAAEANQKIARCLTPVQTARFNDFLIRFPQPGLHRQPSKLQ